MMETSVRLEVEAFRERHPDTRFLDTLMFDLVGSPIGKRYPMRDVEKVCSSGVAFCAGITTLDALGTCWDVHGIGFSDGDPDAVAYPLPGTLVPVPWAAEPTAQVLIQPRHPSDPDGWWFDPRAILARVVRRFEPLGLRPVVACELEFYFVEAARADDGSLRPAVPRATGRASDAPRVLGFSKLDEWAGVLAEIDAACTAQHVPAGAASAEYGGVQFEVNLAHVDDPVRAADHALMLRRIVKGVSARNGLDATFMSKPFGDQSGSGLHVHLSLVDASGANAFDESRAGGEERLRHAVAGLQATAWDSMAIFAPNLNAYRRVGPNLFVPVNTTWGYNNRSVAFRIPAGGSSSRRIEHRIAGAEANPYLVLASVLAGVHHGLVHRLDPGAPSEGNAGENTDPGMPSRLWHALDRIERSALLADYLGQDYPKAYADIKRAEFDAFMGRILPREYDWYA